MSFSDHFSGHADAYGTYRPDYPAALFERVAALAVRRELAWDCGTGNGQAARGLAACFDRVIATDASAAQIASAVPCDGVAYRTAPAEASGLADASVDLVFVAQALHWFDHARFWDEVRRVTRPGAAFAAVTYARCSVGGDDGDAVEAQILRFYDLVEPWWPPERAHVEAGYSTIPCPFPTVDVGPLALEKTWSRDELMGYLGTWSATQRAARAQGADPREGIADAMAEAWGPAEARRRIVWPLRVLAARVRDADGGLLG